MSTFLSLRPTVRAYVIAVVTVGALALGFSVQTLLARPIGSEWLLLAGLTVLTGSFSVKVPSINAYISVSEAFVFASVLLFGAEAGTVTVLLECLVILLWMKPQGRPLYRMFFNMAAPSVAIWTAGRAFYLLSGFQPYSQVFTPLPRLFVPLLAFTASYFLLNSWLVAIAVGLETRRSAAQIWWNNFAWLSVNYFSGASVAALIVTYTQHLDFSTLAVIVPLLVVSYLTFRTAMGRAEDSYNHLAELNRLYLSTIETLAMAIDAKDQITHGHIRRVQIYAVGLARHVGVTDPQLVKAIEAAALLHDMGKLAVPEHILNKPGKLTPAEFEKMKLHAGVGADILSAIDFPYPVVPIVRHHHENWNGTGYPDGLSGTDIPIGARILSVVDCFDALTSDRPYRRKLTDREALDILVERRGMMYDPLVVDTFLRVHTEIAPGHQIPNIDGVVLAEITSSISGKESPPLSPDAGADSGAGSRYHLDAIKSTRATWPDVLSDHVRTLLPCQLAVLYRHEQASDQLVVEAASPSVDGVLANVKIGLGERLSGWVAANRTVIINSDPTLDLGDIEQVSRLGLQNALSVPVMGARELIGVLALYGRDPFSSQQSRVALDTAAAIAERWERQDSGRAANACPAPSRRYPSEPSAIAPVTSLLYVDFVNWQRIERHCGRERWDELRGSLGVDFRQMLGPGDLLIRSRENEFVLLLARAEAKDIRALTRRMRAAIEALNDSIDRDWRIDVVIDTILAPADSASIWEPVTAEQSTATSANPPDAPTRVH